MCTVHHAKARDGQSFVIASVTLLTPRPRRAPPPGALAAFEAGPQGARGRGLWPPAPGGPPRGARGPPLGGPEAPPWGARGARGAGPPGGARTKIVRPALVGVRPFQG